ncbi:MAG TPA: glycosyltransferase [Synergistales bacterium]|jgi:cellulose synthase/poly-beta-1,6-N-acetylglucosamine synthase-like glycosyltransferase|nr:glycosyltransferase [Synergistales bacterium]HRV70930.1 glycosyltransferase [Thermovirgaceae bacterium]
MIGPIDYVFIACLVVIWSVLLYHVVLSYAGYRYSLSAQKEKERLDETPIGELPSVTVLVPAHNEEAVIEKTLLALAAMDYPTGKVEIICINDGSRDRTGKIARKISESSKGKIRVLDVPKERSGKGKSEALNFGLEHASGEIIAVYDADNTPERSALLYLVRNLVEGKDALGAVIGKFRTRNQDRNLLTRFINLETIFFQWTTQAGRWNLYRLATIPGTNFVVWTELLKSLKGWDPKALTEDTELSIRIYLAGKFIKMIPYAVTWEEEPERWPVWFRQRTRWAMGNIYVLKKYFLSLLFRGKFRLYWDILYMLLIYFLFLTSVTTSLVIFLLGLTGIGNIVLEGPFNILWFLAAVLFVTEMGISLTAEPGEDRATNLTIALVMYFTYSQLWLIVMFNALIKSFLSLFRKGGHFWVKTERAG